MWLPIASLVFMLVHYSMQPMQNMKSTGQVCSKTWLSAFGLQENHLGTQACPTMHEDIFLLLRLRKGSTSTEIYLLTHKESLVLLHISYCITGLKYSRTGHSLLNAAKEGFLCKYSESEGQQQEPIRLGTWYFCYNKFPLGRKYVYLSDTWWAYYFSLYGTHYKENSILIKRKSYKH